MDITEPAKSSLKKLGEVKRKAVGLSEERSIEVEPLIPGKTQPLVIKPAVSGIELASWANTNRQLLEEYLLKHGAVLFRGFNLRTVAAFGR